MEGGRRRPRLSEEIAEKLGWRSEERPPPRDRGSRRGSWSGWHGTDELELLLWVVVDRGPGCGTRKGARRWTTTRYSGRTTSRQARSGRLKQRSHRCRAHTPSLSLPYSAVGVGLRQTIVALRFRTGSDTAATVSRRTAVLRGSSLATSCCYSSSVRIIVLVVLRPLAVSSRVASPTSVSPP